ncbi:ribulose-phosphate 3-epimerase [Kandleria vitulina DSM 20405]|jgi:ribulose-phosphate 3-epimerase|uniref:Ribulose-phosphate 3-epimerase n=1 Tax=Kandleria vitulina DSM 20405 TaxID=1410657 RepID=A0A0R2HDD9_9FIRM|nr:ribulose-phosphate 3-epimerase [Kandleria vitulina]KRN51041.1 ribulose-phosphate 3-epimerase [Kandleria vitulina DSM 20405]
MTKVAPSVLSADFSKLKEEIDTLEGAKWLHYDVMDGHFVPNISFGYSILANVRKATDLFLDVHLMITDPMFYVDEFIKAGADMITFHIEAMESREKTMELINHIHASNVQVGISIKPGTHVDAILPYLNDVDMILVMSVEPGFGGQSFNDIAVEKIKTLNSLKGKYGFIIEVDGGINEQTGKLCVEAGCDVLVAGSYVFKAASRRDAIASLLCE